MIKVSILIPLYNSASFIAETIKTTLEQSWPNIEIIIVDDGSTDNSYEIARSFESSNVKIFKQKNSGACRARNLAFEKSTGEFIQYLDADDILHPLKIENQIKIFQQFNNHIVCSGIWGRFHDSVSQVTWEHQDINKDYDYPYQWINESWLGYGMGQTSIWLVHRDLIERAGPWDENLLLNQDGDFFSRVLFNATAIKFSEHAKVYYRSGNSDSISQSQKFSKIKAQSLLRSYISYKSTSKKYEFFEELRHGLGTNFLNFIYQNYNLFPTLVAEASSQFYDLGFKKMWPVGGEDFKKIAKIIGFKNALNCKKIIGKLNRA